MRFVAPANSLAGKAPPSRKKRGRDGAPSGAGMGTQSGLSFLKMRTEGARLSVIQTQAALLGCRVNEGDVQGSSGFVELGGLQTGAYQVLGLVVLGA